MLVTTGAGRMVPREMPHDKGRKCAMKWRKFYPNEKRNVPVCEINEDETTLIVDLSTSSI